VTPCNVVVGHPPLGWSCCFTLKTETVMSSEKSVSYRNITRCQNPEDLEMNLHQRENMKTHVNREISSMKQGMSSDECRTECYLCVNIKQWYMHTTYQCTKFHMFSSIASLIITIKWESKYTFRAEAMLLFCILQKNTFTKPYVFIEDLVPRNTSKTRH